MTESRLYDLSQQLRLLARRDCKVGRHGGLLGGSLDLAVEDARLRLLDVLEQFQDFRVLEVDAVDTIAYCQELAWRHRHQITALRRQAEFEQQLEAQAPRPLRFEAA